MFWYMDISFEDNEIVILKNGQCSMIFIGIGVYISIWNDLICLCASVHISAATSIPVFLKDESDIIGGSRNNKIFYKYLRDISLGWSLFTCFCNKYGDDEKHHHSSNVNSFNELILLRLTFKSTCLDWSDETGEVIEISISGETCFQITGYPHLLESHQ